MSTKRECPEKYGWWRNGLGVIANKRNEFNNLKELCNLAENIKQTFYHNYKSSLEELQQTVVLTPPLRSIRSELKNT